MHANTITITPEQLEMIKADITTQVIKSLTGQDLRSVPAFVGGKDDFREKRCIRSEEGQPI